MATRRVLPFPDTARPLWLLVALAVLLLVCVSLRSPAGATPAGSLLDGLARDAAALRLQLEGLDARHEDRPGLGFNADIGDGGVAFRWQAATQHVRAAQRRAQNLALAYRRAADEARALIADGLAVQLLEVAAQLGELKRAPDEVAANDARRDVETSLARFERLLASLRAEAAAPVPLRRDAKEAAAPLPRDGTDDASHGAPEAAPSPPPTVLRGGGE